MRKKSHFGALGGLHVAAGILPAVEGGIPATRNLVSDGTEDYHVKRRPLPQIQLDSHFVIGYANSGRQDAALYGRQDARRYDLREWINEAATPAGLSDWAISRESIYD